MAMQYQRHAGNAISAIDAGDIGIAKRQLDLAILAQRKRLQQRQQLRRTTTTTTVVEEPAEPAEPAAAPEAVEMVVVENPQGWQWRLGYRPALPSLPGKIAVQASRTQIFLVLMVWSGLSALHVNSVPHWMQQVALPASQTATTLDVDGLPVTGRVSSPPGWRTHPITGLRRWHAGTDIAAPVGTPIHATGSGTVIYAGKKGGYGNTVIIGHGAGVTTLYGHMHSISVKVGGKVSKGAVIGTVGSTGNSTGPHVHYEKRGAAKQKTVNNTQFDNHISAAAREFGLDPKLVKAVIWKESTFDPKAYSGKAHGLMQLTPTTGAMVARQLGMKSPDLYDPATNIRLGSKYLADLIRQFGRLDLALAAYNAGPTAVTKHGGIPPYPETRGYVSKITAYYNNLKKEA